jgi:hypothetical protein
LIQSGVNEAGTVEWKILKTIHITNMSSSTSEKQIDIYISNDEVTYIPIIKALNISNISQYYFDYYKIPADYSIYMRASTSATNNNEYFDFALGAAVQTIV